MERCSLFEARSPLPQRLAGGAPDVVRRAARLSTLIGLAEWLRKLLSYAPADPFTASLVLAAIRIAFTSVKADSSSVGRFCTGLVVATVIVGGAVGDGLDATVLALSLDTGLSPSAVPVRGAVITATAAFILALAFNTGLSTLTIPIGSAASLVWAGSTETLVFVTD